MNIRTSVVFVIATFLITGCPIAVHAAEANFRIRIHHAEILPLKRNGKCWDFCTESQDLKSMTADIVADFAQRTAGRIRGLGAIPHIPFSARDAVDKGVGLFLKKALAFSGPASFATIYAGRMILGKATKKTRLPDPAVYLHFHSPQKTNAYFSRTGYALVQRHVRACKRIFGKRKCRWKRKATWVHGVWRESTLSTGQKKNTLSPRWEKDFIIRTDIRNTMLVSVEDVDKHTLNDPIGHITIPLQIVKKKRKQEFCLEKFGQVIVLCMSVEKLGH